MPENLLVRYAQAVMKKPGVQKRTPRQRIVVGQRVREEKTERAREFRGTPTTAERLLWQILRNGQIDGARFRRQQIIDGFIVDFYCHEAALVVEVDGSVHQSLDAYDQPRDAVLTARGLHVLRVTNAQIFTNLPLVVHTIREVIAQRIGESALPGNTHHT